VRAGLFSSIAAVVGGMPGLARVQVDVVAEHRGEAVDKRDGAKPWAQQFSAYRRHMSCLPQRVGQSVLSGQGS